MTLKSAIINVFIILSSLYFGFHLIWGQKGYIKYSELKNDLQAKTNEFQELRAKRVILENRIALLNAHSLNLDTLDEYSRKILGIAGEDELVIPNPK
jgi:cell division protein FtsB